MDEQRQGHVGCALGPARVWFTVGYGILNEVYYRASMFRKSAISDSLSPMVKDSGSRSRGLTLSPIATGARHSGA